MENEKKTGTEETKMFTMRLDVSIIEELNRLVEKYKTSVSEVIRISLRISLPETEKRLREINIAKGLRGSIVDEGK